MTFVAFTTAKHVRTLCCAGVMTVKPEETVRFESQKYAIEKSVHFA